MSAAQVKSQCLFNNILVGKLAADVVVFHQPDRCLFDQLGQMFVVEGEFQADDHLRLQVMDTGNSKADSILRDIADVDDSTSTSRRFDDPVGAGQAGLLAVMAAEVELGLENGIAFTANLENMFFVPVMGNRCLGRGIAGRTDNCCRVVRSDKNFNSFHKDQS